MRKTLPIIKPSWEWPTWLCFRVVGPALIINAKINPNLDKEKCIICCGMCSILENTRPDASNVMWGRLSGLVPGIKMFYKDTQKWDERGGLRGKFGNSVNYEKSPCCKGWRV